ncbi:hypothetical protein [Paenibacillus sp. FSL R5-808]|jgi:hypothetical protein|uniref:hypothetical protein n=1 Tax=unclassified Paenibacillus TaxID=185978 RepID=UPI0003E21734|nr:hypothetical protein [Paenibacillus sp. FSL R5-808]ETT32159.1 hypothetical protein C169_24155 [Paenibacillus sp. FSL R5-808]
MLQQALQKLQKEIGEKSKDSLVQHIGGLLISHIRKHPEHAAFILTEDKTIAGSWIYMESEARKRNVRGMSDDEGMVLVLKYFGVPVQEASPIIVEPELSISSIDDLL